MNITLLSSFRNAIPYLANYFAQIISLDYELHERGDKLSLIWGEGDSTDDTLQRLTAAQYRFKASLVDVSHGGPEYGSIVDAERFQQLAHVGNTMLATLRKKELPDAVIWVESDLIWEASTMLKLLDDLASYPAVAPLCLLQREGWPAGTFYDTWAYRKDGKQLTHRRPHFKENDFATMAQLDSAGSCLVMRGELLEKASFPDDDIFVGFCRQLVENGATLWLDPTVQVTHL